MSRRPGPDPLEVLGRLQIITTEDNKGLWLPPVSHVPELNKRMALEFEKCLSQIRGANVGINPKGLVVRGQMGVGKTHFARYVRSQVEKEHGYFIVIKLVSGRHFWQSALTGMITSLHKDGQLRRLLRDLASSLGMNGHQIKAVSGLSTPTLVDIDDFVARLVGQDPEVGAQASDTARALILFAANSALKLHEAGRAYFRMSPGSAAMLRRGGIEALPEDPQMLLSQLSMLMAKVGPTVFAIDQIDSLLQESRSSGLVGDRRVGPGGHDQLIDQIAHGLMELREDTYRSLILLTCLQETWRDLENQAIGSMRDRFIVPASLGQLPSVAVASELVERRLTEHYKEEGFQPDYPTWPIHASAFESAARYTPRTLLERVQKHVNDCVEYQALEELRDLTEGSVAWPSQVPVESVDVPVASRQGDTLPANTQGDASDWTEIDQRYSELLEAVDLTSISDPQHQDRLAPDLFAAVLTAWGKEQSALDGHRYEAEPSSGQRPGVHASLHRVGTPGDRPPGWSFLLLDAPHHKTVLARIPAAIDAAGLTSGGSLAVLRNADWPGGPGSVTRERLDRLHAIGGVESRFSDEDARTMLALQTLIEDAPEGLQDWLIARQHAHKIEVFRKVLPGGGGSDADESGPAPPSTPPQTSAPTSTSTSPGSASVTSSVRAQSNGKPGPTSHDRSEPVVALGRTRRDDRPFTIPLRLLRKHVLVVAGSGAGKTVLLKRLIEEVALQGVSSVVLDPNNDLSRMGEAWPEPPETWTPQDAEAADTYFRSVEVVVWTPRRSAGRPLQFDPIPDVAAFASDPDEFSAAVDLAVSVLAPRANLHGSTSKAAVGRAVLTEALNFFGRRGEHGLEALIDLLDDLPDEATTFDDGHALARSMAISFRAARVTDRLFAADVPSTDPQQLLTPSEGKRARISVINFVGLQRLEQAQSFVSQLQLALFATFRRNPSRDPLGALLVMDEAQDFVPPQGSTPSTESTLQLAAQARKFGLGIAFATQAPRGLHNRVAGNTASQFIGRLTHPTQIDAAEKLARARGGEVPDIARLGPGQFFAATEGTTPTKIAAAMSLSHHPDGPPTEEEILQLARPTPSPGAAPFSS